jgi:hypothetical protein
MAFDQQHLRDLGFVGFVPLRAVQPKCSEIPDQSGVYAVTLKTRPAAFVPRSFGGRFKGKDPTVPIGTLERKWLDETETVYIGRASSLRDRLALLARFGQGHAVGHWGGRYLWQIAAVEDLQVCWRLESDAVDAECGLLDSFEVTMGALPFANLVRGARPALAA